MFLVQEDDISVVIHVALRDCDWLQFLRKKVFQIGNETVDYITT